MSRKETVQGPIDDYMKSLERKMEMYNNTQIENSRAKLSSITQLLIENGAFDVAKQYIDFLKNKAMEQNKEESLKASANNLAQLKKAASRKSAGPGKKNRVAKGTSGSTLTNSGHKDPDEDKAGQ